MNSLGLGFQNSSLMPRSVTELGSWEVLWEQSPRHRQVGRRAAKDLHQKKMSKLVIAVNRARLRRQPTPMRGRADSRHTTLSTVVTNSDGSSPFNLKQDTGLQTHSKAPRSRGIGPTQGWALRPLLAYEIDSVSWLHAFPKFPTLAT